MPLAELLPNPSKGQVLQFFGENETPREIKRCFEVLEFRLRHQQRPEKCLLHIPRSDDPIGRTTDRGVEEVEPYACPIEQVGEDELVRHRLNIVVQKDHMIAVPSHGARDVEQYLVERECY